MTSPNYCSRKGHNVQFIVVHWWGNPAHHRDGDPSGVIKHLSTPAGEKSVSAHAVVWPGGVTELIDPRYAAWHAKSVNRYSIGIECWPWDERSPRDLVNATLENLAQQIAHYYQLYPHLADVRLHAHSEHVATECPGKHYRARLDSIRARALEIYQGKPAKQPQRKEIPKMIIFRTPEGVCTIFLNGETKQNPSQALLNALINAGVPVVEISHDDLAWLEPSKNWQFMASRIKDLKDMETGYPGINPTLKATSLTQQIATSLGISQRTN